MIENLVLSPKCIGPKLFWAEVFPGQSRYWAEVLLGPKYSSGQYVPRAKVCLGPNEGPKEGSKEGPKEGPKKYPKEHPKECPKNNPKVLKQEIIK